MDEDGALYVNGNGTLFNVDSDSLFVSGTGVADLTAQTEFSVYKGEVNYYRTDTNIVSRNLTTLVATTLTGPLVYAGGGGDTHAFSASGRYVADESAAGSIRIIDTRSGDSALFAVGGANAVTELQFNEDGDRIYYTNQETNAIHYVDLQTDSSGNVQLSPAQLLIQGKNANSFQGLDMGGANYNTKTDFYVSEDGISKFTYEAADLSLYSLGINNEHIDTLQGANTAAIAIKESVNRASAERAKIGARAARFEFMRSSHQSFIANTKEIESLIRDVDLAKESTELAVWQMREMAASSMLKEYRNVSMNVLRLLQ